MEKIIVTNEHELEALILKSVRKVFQDGTLKINSDTLADRIFSIKEASDFLNLAQQTLYGFTSKRLIPFMKRGKKLYFRQSDLEKWLLEGRKKTREEI